MPHQYRNIWMVLGNLGLAGLLLLRAGLSLAFANFGQLTRVTTTASGRSNNWPSMSADGSKIVFHSDADFLSQGDILTGQFEIWLYDTATMTLTRLTTASANDRTSVFPEISTDGTKVAFYSDSDFLGQGILAFQSEIWLAGSGAEVCLPIIVKSS